MKCENCCGIKPGEEIICDFAKYRSKHHSCVYSRGDKAFSSCVSVFKSSKSFIQSEGFSNNIFEIFYFYFYMLRSGCFSLPDTFTFKEDVVDYKTRYMFANVFTGYGTCRHIADHFRIFINSIDGNFNPIVTRGYTSVYITDFNPRRAISLSKKLDVVKSYLEVITSSKTDKYSKINYGNHVIVHVVDNGRVILLDPLNLYSFLYTGDRKCRVLSGTGSFTITGLTFSFDRDLNIDRTLDLFDNERNRRLIIDKEEVVSSFYKVHDFYNSHSDLFVDFKEQNMDNIGLLKRFVEEESQEILSLHK